MNEQSAVVPTEHYYRIGPACKYVGGVSEQLFRKLHREGKGPARSRISGKLIIYSKTSLDIWLASQADLSAAKQVAQ
jgi:hypothetical protein